MESSIECVTDGLMDEDEISSQFSSSKSSHTNNLNGMVINPATSVHELLECPVCTNSMYPPIHQCHNGHTICSTCKYSTLGCPEIFPYYKCSVVGDIPYVVAHLRDDHKVDMHSGCTFNHRYVKSNPRDVENATWMLTVFHCFGQYFCLHFEAFQLGMAPVYMAFLRFMGDEMDARNYSYSLEVGGNGRKLIWEGTPRSIRDSHRKVRDSHDGLIIQRNMALFFSGGDRKELKLRVTGRIWKEQQNPDGGACIPNFCS
ncbi:E3 ubiquitin-protein ligase sinat5 [Salvia divinorum]|uniref:E3 ubiquitin-protein ligase sinat5 n=1 Tax=Salvia divinorum TaxID=28513 RepID=A0ABD1GPY3_SALDI